MVKMFLSILGTVSTVQSSSSSFVSFLLSSEFAPSGRCFLLLLLASVCVPFVNGVTCNSQNVIGFPYLFIGLVDLSLVDLYFVQFGFHLVLCFQTLLNRYYRFDLPL